MASFVGISDQPLGYPSPFGYNSIAPNFNGYAPNVMKTTDDYGYTTIRKLGPGLIQTPNGLSPASDSILPIPGLFQSGVQTNYYNYMDVNSDPDLRNKTVRYFKDKAIYWLLNDGEYKSLLNYFVVRNDAKKIPYVDVVRETSEYNKQNKDSSEDIKLKVKFIVHYILKKRLIARILEKYGVKTNMKWWNFKANTEEIKDVIRHELKRKIKSSLSNE
jgi:hypothetical protein